MDFQTLKASVNSALGRDDVPSYVYTLMMADVNRDIRILEMQALYEFTASSEAVNLPSDFLSVESMYVDTTPRTPLVPITRQAEATRHNSSGKPYYYAVTVGIAQADVDVPVNIHKLQFMPVPDGSYSIVLRYYTKLDDFSGDTDTNDVIALHPALFLYLALHHAAVWKQDIELATSYGMAAATQIELIEKSDRKKRNSGPMIQRTAVQL